MTAIEFFISPIIPLMWLIAKLFPSLAHGDERSGSGGLGAAIFMILVLMVGFYGGLIALALTAGWVYSVLVYAVFFFIGYSTAFRDDEERI